jgi:CheY-like chemotaxis protein
MRTPTIQVLLVDDDLHIRSLGRELLEKLGYEVETAASGEEVLEKFHRGRPLDLVILDYHLPGMSGLEVVQRLKALSPDTGCWWLPDFSPIVKKRRSLPGGQGVFWTSRSG